MPRDDWAKYTRRDRGRKAARDGSALHSSFSGILKRPKSRKRRKKTKLSAFSRPNKPIRKDRPGRTLCNACGNLRNIVDAKGICNPCHSNGNAIRWIASQPVLVNQRAQNQATGGLTPAGSPAAGTDRHDELCQIPDHVNGVSSRRLPDHDLASDVRTSQPHSNGTSSTRTERAARCDQSVSGTDRDEDTRERPSASSLADSAG
jgi:hypothetical protein